MEMELPLDIVENIFKFLDCASIVRASGVSKMWRTIYVRLVIYKDLYKNCCHLEISQESLFTVLDGLYPNVSLQDDRIDWEKVYKCWYITKHFGKWDLFEKCILQEKASKINCMKVSGDWLFYGASNEGLLGMINLEKEEPPFVHLCGHGYFDIDLIYSEDSKNSDIKLYHDRINCLNVVTCKIVSYSIGDSIEGFGDRMLEYELSGTNNKRLLMEWIKSVKSNYCLKMKAIGLNVSHIKDSLSLNITDKLFFSIDQKEPDDVHILKCHYPMNVEEDIIDSELAIIYHYYQLSANITIGLVCKPYRMVFFFVGEDCRAYLTIPSMFKITSALFHSNLLILGNDRGTVFIYNLENDRTLLDFDIKDFRSYDLSTHYPIVGLAIQYSKQNLPYLVVATTSAIFTLHFSKHLNINLS